MSVYREAAKVEESPRFNEEDKERNFKLGLIGGSRFNFSKDALIDILPLDIHTWIKIIFGNTFSIDLFKDWEREQIKNFAKEIIKYCSRTNYDETEEDQIKFNENWFYYSFGSFTLFDTNHNFFLTGSRKDFTYLAEKLIDWV